jgi:hypothetical protein
MRQEAIGRIWGGRVGVNKSHLDAQAALAL